MLPEAPLPHVVPPSFSPRLERELRVVLAQRLGREGNADEIQAYRQLVWAIAIAIDAITRTPATAATPPPAPPSWPEPPSTHGSPQSRTIAKS
jgi:hypothetical protein